MKVLFSVFFLLLVTFSVFSFGKKDMNNSSQCAAAGNTTADNGGGSTVKITGRIQIYGNEPHTFAGIIDENGVEYAIYPPSKEDELRTLQGYVIEFIVEMLDEPRGLGGLQLRGGTVTPVEWRIIEQ